MSRSLTYDQAYWNTKRFHDRMQQLDQRYIARARLLAHQAGICPDYPFLHASNAICCKNGGNPWPNKDYDLINEILEIRQRMHKLTRLYMRYSDKQYQRCYQLAHFG